MSPTDPNKTDKTLRQALSALVGREESETLRAKGHWQKKDGSITHAFIKAGTNDKIHIKETRTEQGRVFSLEKPLLAKTTVVGDFKDPASPYYSSRPRQKGDKPAGTLVLKVTL